MQLSLYPAEILRVRSAVVPDPTQLRRLVEPMVRIMKEHEGVGLAAPQVGIAERFFVSALPGDEVRLFVNPEITDRARRTVRSEEMCLSLPGVTALVRRSAWVTVRYSDLDGEAKEVTAHGLLSRVVQHELDHLDGVLFVDYLAARRRNRLLSRITTSDKGKEKKWT